MNEPARLARDWWFTRRVGRPLLMALAMSGCTGVLNSTESSRVSSAYEPPRSWDSALLFRFEDSTQSESERYGARIEFFDGERQRSVTGADVFRQGGSSRTPWYRVSMPASGEFATTVRITIGDLAGARTVAEYPLTMKANDFYYVRFGIGTLEPGLHPPTNPMVEELRGYDVPAGARRAPSDSLWVSHVTRGRYCFDCPR
jgi:hypothetical protein